MLNETARELNETASTLDKVSSGLASIAAFFGNISHAVQVVFAWLSGLGLSSTQAAVVLGILFLLVFLGVLKFIVLITKLLIIGLIIWVVLSILGVL